MLLRVATCSRARSSVAVNAQSAPIRAISVLAVGVRDAALCGCLFLLRVPVRASASVSLRNHLPEKIDGLFLDRRRPPARLCLGQRQSAPCQSIAICSASELRAHSLSHPDYRVTQTTHSIRPRAGTPLAPSCRGSCHTRASKGACGAAHASHAARCAVAAVACRKAVGSVARPVYDRRRCRVATTWATINGNLCHYF